MAHRSACSGNMVSIVKIERSNLESYPYLDQRRNSSAGERFLYLLSSLSDAPMGGARANSGRLLLVGASYSPPPLLLYASMFSTACAAESGAPSPTTFACFGTNAGVKCGGRTLLLLLALSCGNG